MPPRNTVRISPRVGKIRMSVTGGNKAETGADRTAENPKTLAITTFAEVHQFVKIRIIPN